MFWVMVWLENDFFWNLYWIVVIIIVLRVVGIKVLLFWLVFRVGEDDGGEFVGVVFSVIMIVVI